MKDFFLTIGTIVVLIALFYLFTSFGTNIYALLILLLILIPTLKALIQGAPFVPTPMPACEKMVELAQIKPGDKVYDLGCGDGRIVYLASKNYQADAVGYELSPIVFILALIKKITWKSGAKIRLQDFKKKDLSDAKTVFCYLMPDTLNIVQNKFLKELKSGTKIISYAFAIPGLPKLIHKEPSDSVNHLASIYVYEI